MPGILVSIEGLKEFWEKLDVEKFRALEAKALEQVGSELLTAIRQATPVRTGRLAGSWVASTGRGQFTIGTGVEYAPYVEFGSEPHEIYPRRARALRFEAGGEVVYARRVMHPGTRPRRFVRDVIYNMRGKILYIIREVMGEGLKE